MLEKTETGFCRVETAGAANGRDGAEFAADDAGGFQFVGVLACHTLGQIGRSRPGRVEFPARTVDFKRSERLLVGRASVEDILAAPFRIPEYLVTF